MAKRTSAVIAIRFVDGDGDQATVSSRDSPPRPGNGMPLKIRRARFIAETPFRRFSRSSPRDCQLAFHLIKCVTR